MTDAKQVGTPRRLWLRIVVTVVACTLCSMVLHAVGPEMSYPRPSPLLTSPAFRPVMMTLLAATFLLLAIVFVRAQHLWPARGRGLRFVAGLAPVWFCGVMFMPLYAGSTWSQELYTGLVDVAVLGGLGLLLGRLLATPASHDESASRPRPIAVALIALVWLARYEAQRRLLGLGLSASAAPEAVVCWELATGASIGWFYLLVGYRAGSRPALTQALWFAGFVFGLQYLLSGVYGPAFVVLSDPATYVLSMVVDVVTVFLAVLAYERLFAGEALRARSGVAAALMVLLGAGTAQAEGAYSVSGEIAFTADGGELLIALCTKGSSPWTAARSSRG